VYGSSVIQLPSAPIEAVWSPHDKNSLQCLYWNSLSRLNFIFKQRVHRVLELELEETKADCAMF